MSSSVKNIVIAPLDADHRWCTDYTWINRIDRNNTIYFIISCDKWRKDKTLTLVENKVKSMDIFNVVEIDDNDFSKVIKILEDNCNGKAYVYVLNNEKIYDTIRPNAEKIFAGIHNLKSINQLNKMKKQSSKEIQRQKSVENNGDLFGLMNEISNVKNEKSIEKKSSKKTESDFILNEDSKKRSDNENNVSKVQKHLDSDALSINNVCNEQSGEENKNESENDIQPKRREKLEDKRPAAETDVEKILREKEKKIFGTKFENIELHFQSGRIATAKASLISELQLRLIQNIDYMMPALKEKKMTVEDYIGIINLFLITDDEQSFIMNLKNKVKDPRLNFASEKMYPRLLAEVNYYKKICDLLYSEDKWD